MIKEYRLCNKIDCIEVNEIGYHYYKNGTKHIAMICPVHKYTCLPFEELELRDFTEVKIEYSTKKHKQYKEVNQDKLARRTAKRLRKIEQKELEKKILDRSGLPVSELLSL